jgi:hypothetical protein
MAKGSRRAAHRTIDFDLACEVLEEALRGTVRHDFIGEALKARDFAGALRRVRTAMTTHTLRVGARALRLADIVEGLDARARREGFHVLKEWDQAAHTFSREDVPVLMLDYFAANSTPSHQKRQALAVLLDFYLLYVLALLVMRVWDEGDPNRNMDRVTGLLGDLQGARGSGQRFVQGASTLLFVATSNFQPDDRAYLALLDKVRSLDDAHRVQVALVGAPVLGTHLRWALTAIYERDLVRMRDDNAVDYPWLFFSVWTLVREYARLHDAGAGEEARARVTDALLNGLSADPWAFVATPPASLGGFAEAHAELRSLLARYREELLPELEAHAPAEGVYTPTSLQFNFPHNALVALVVLALLASVPLPNLPLDALLSRPRGGLWKDDAAELLARGVTGYAAAHPERRGDRRVLIVAYNPPLGLRTFTRTMSALRKEGTGSGSEDPHGAAAGEAAGPDQSAAMPSS